MDVISKFAEQVLISIAPLIAVPLFIWLITMAMQAISALKAKAPQIYELLYQTIPTLVQAAEQSGLRGSIQDKKTVVLQLATTLMAEKGLNINLGLVDAAVERAVWVYINSQNPAKNSALPQPTIELPTGAVIP